MNAESISESPSPSKPAAQRLHYFYHTTFTTPEQIDTMRRVQGCKEDTPLRKIDSRRRIFYCKTVLCSYGFCVVDANTAGVNSHHVYVKSEHNHALGKPIGPRGRPVDLTTLHLIDEVGSKEELRARRKALGVKRQRDPYSSGKIYFRCFNCKQFAVWAVPIGEGRYSLYTNRAIGEHPLPCPKPAVEGERKKRAYVRRVEKPTSNRAPRGSAAAARDGLIATGYHLVATCATQAEVKALRAQQYAQTCKINYGGALNTYICKRNTRPRGSERCLYKLAVLNEDSDGERYSVYSRGEHNHPLGEPPAVRSIDYTFCRYLASREEIVKFKNSGYVYTGQRTDEGMRENMRRGERMGYYRCVKEGCPRRVRLHYSGIPEGRKVTYSAEWAELYERGQHNHV